MKKLLIVMFGVFILTGCGNSGEEFTCTINNSEAIFTIKDGIISSYTLDGEKQSRSTIDEINGTYFKLKVYPALSGVFPRYDLGIRQLFRKKTEKK